MATTDDKAQTPATTLPAPPAQSGKSATAKTGAAPAADIEKLAVHDESGATFIPRGMQSVSPELVEQVTAGGVIAPTQTLNGPAGMQSRKQTVIETKDAGTLVIPGSEDEAPEAAPAAAVQPNETPEDAEKRAKEQAKQAESDEDDSEGTAWADQTNAELQAELSKRGLPTSGSKADLIERLEDDDDKG
jgi:hypothetical protein